MSLNFQVAAVSKPLLAVKRIVEKGNHVSFGPEFVGGGKTEVTVDSGAEESVCPWEWGQQFGCRVSSE
eukprot:1219967-Karenia_brevis.AAC.1